MATTRKKEEYFATGKKQSWETQWAQNFNMVEKTEIIDFCLLGNAEAAETTNSVKQSEEGESEGGTKGERTASKEKFSHFPADLQRSVTE